MPHHDGEPVNIEVNKSGDMVNSSQTISVGGEGMSDVQSGIEFIYHLREHLVDIGIATIYGLFLYAAVLWIQKKIKG